MKKAKELQVTSSNEAASVESFISQAITSNVSVETLERLFELREKVKAEAAKEAYISGMSKFQAACPVIKKTKKVLNKDGSIRYVFAPIDSIIEQTKAIVAENGFSYRWETKNPEGGVTAICIVTHIMGHSESTDFTAAIDQAGYMTAPQKTASALTFAKRYTFCNAFGISTGDEDTDATDSKKQSVAKSDKSKIVFLLRGLNQKTSTKEEIIEAIERLTSLKLSDKNLGDIVGRLETLVQENHENA